MLFGYWGNKLLTPVEPEIIVYLKNWGPQTHMKNPSGVVGCAIRPRDINVTLEV